MRLALLVLTSVAAMAQLPPLTLPAYDMFRYAVAGRPFNYRFVPGGGAAPYSFALEEDSFLPPGLQLNGGTGELSGTIGLQGEYRQSVCISDATKARICVPFLVIVVAKEGDTYTEVPPARVNAEYQSLITKPGEFADLSYLPVSGKLPPGMVLEVTGRLYGIPRPPGGAWAFRVQGKDAEGNTVTKPYLIRVLGPLAATSAMPNGFDGIEYSSQITLLGDAPPHVWAVRRGPLPPGYGLSENGRISGISTRIGTYPFALRVTDSTGASEDREMTLTVEGRLQPIQVTNAALPGASVGAPYRQQINITGGRAPYTFRTLGSLPPGLTLSSSALLSGTPTAAGSFIFTLQVTDVSGTNLSKSFTITVGNLRYTGPATVSFFALEESRLALSAEGGTAPVRWSVVSGMLPAGISLSESGVLSGAAATPANAMATLRLIDALGRSVEAPVAITVNAARPVISANGVVNGASFAAGSIAPGEIVTLFGARMGPANLAPFTLDASRRVPGALAGTRVLFGGQPAPLLYVSASQIGAIVPYSAGGGSDVEVVVDSNGVRSAPVRVAVAPAAPGLFTVDASGKGQAAALNQDGTLNAKSAPARPGEILVLFGTGEGITRPAGQDGAVTGPETPRPELPVEVAIGGKPGVVLYAGGAPGLVAGLFQINVRIPADVEVGESVSVVLRVGGAASPAGVTLAVR